MANDKVTAQLEELTARLDTLYVLLEALINYLYSLGAIDIEDFNNFMKEHRVSDQALLRKADESPRS